MTVGLDTSVVIRLLTGVPTAHAEAARTFVASAPEALAVSDLVAGESYFALRHHYDVPHADAVRAIAALLDDPRIHATGVARGVMRDAALHPASRRASARGRAPRMPGIIDQLITADYRADQCHLVTFDRDLARLEGVHLLGA